MTLSAHDVFRASTALIESLSAKIATNSGALDVEDLKNLRDVVAWIARDAEAADSFDAPPNGMPAGSVSPNPR